MKSTSSVTVALGRSMPRVLPRGSLRANFVGASVALTALALVAVTALVLLTTWMRHANARFGENLGRVSEIERLRDEFRRYDRESYLYLVAGAAEHETARDTAAVELRGLINRIRARRPLGREAALVAALVADVDHRLVTRSPDAVPTGTSLQERYRAMTDQDLLINRSGVGVLAGGPPLHCSQSDWASTTAGGRRAVERG